MFSLGARTCWILGAGASFDALGNGRTGVPLTSELSKFLDTKKLMELLTPLLHEAGAAEEVLGRRLNLTIDAVRSLCLSTDISVARRAGWGLRELIRAIAEAVSMGSAMMMIRADGSISNQGGYDAYNYGWLAGSCCKFPTWSVINMNYDCLLDWGFELISTYADRFPQSRQYEFWKRSLQALFSQGAMRERAAHGTYVKLHGSLHLYSCQNIECPRYRQPFSIENNGEVKFFLLRSEKLCPSCGLDAVELPRT